MQNSKMTEAREEKSLFQTQSSSILSRIYPRQKGQTQLASQEESSVIITQNGANAERSTHQNPGLNSTASQSRLVVNLVSKRSFKEKAEQSIEFRNGVMSLTKAKAGPGMALSPLPGRTGKGSSTKISNVGLANSMAGNQNQSQHFQKSIGSRRGKGVSGSVNAVTKEKGSNQEEKNYLTPLDFIQLIRSDPEMADEFCYMIKNENAYDWRIVEFSEIYSRSVGTTKSFDTQQKKKEYMTISARGITHFIDDEAEFMNLDEWEREVKLYHELKEIPFFYNYKKWKNFTLWRQLRKRNTFKKRKQFLEKNYFLAEEKLRTPLMNSIIRVCSVISNDMKLVDISPSNIPDPLKIEAFKSHEQSNMLKVATHIETSVQTIQAKLESSCNDSMEKFKKENRIRSRNPDKLDDDDDQAPPLLVGDESNKEMPYTQEATIRTHHKRLKRYIKFVDYLIINAKINMVINSLTSLYDYIFTNNENVADGYVFNTGLSSILVIEGRLRDNELVSVPSWDEATKTFDEIITRGVTHVANQHKLLIKAPEFEVYVKQEMIDQEEEVINISRLILGHDAYTRFRKQITSEFKKALEYLEPKMKYAQKYLDIYLEHMNFKVSSFQTQEKTEIQETVERFRKHNELMGNFLDSIERGMIMFDVTKMKLQVKDCAKNSLQIIEKELPILTSERARIFTEKISEYSDILSRPITEVDQFIEFLSDWEKIKEEKEETLKSYSLIKEVIDFIVEAEKIRCSENVRNTFKELSLKMVQLNRTMEEVENRMDSMKNSNKGKLMSLVPEIGKKLKELIQQLYKPLVTSKDSNPQDVVDYLENIEEFGLKPLGVLARNYASYEETLEMERTNMENIFNFENEFGIYLTFWSTKNNWEKLLAKWRKQVFFTELDLGAIEKKMEETINIAQRCSAEIESSEAMKVFRDESKAFRDYFALMQSLKEPALGEEEWNEIKEEIKQVAGENFKDFNITDETFNLRVIEDMRMVECFEIIGSISVRASKEKNLRDDLRKIEIFFENSTVEMTEYKGMKDVYRMGNVDALIRDLDDKLVTASNLLTLKHVGRLKQQVEAKVNLLKNFQLLLDEWLLCQRQWAYLEPIFASADMAKALPKDTKQFQKEVSAPFIQMNKVASYDFKKVKIMLENKDLKYLSDLRRFNKEMEILQKSIENFLESKRKDFPRFFFISNDDLLEILAKGKDFSGVQPHLKKLFDSINTLEIDGTERITQMVSMEGDRVDINPPIPFENSDIQTTLKIVESSMLAAVKKEFSNARNAFLRKADKRTEWVFEHSPQAILTCDSVSWTLSTEKCLKSDDEDPVDLMQSWSIIVQDQLREIVKMLVEKELTSNQRRLVNSLITQDVHYRDIVEQLVQEEVDSPEDFKWLLQLRMYYRENIECEQVNAKLKYGYEYLGIPSKLAITPLTDQCWMTITSALHIKLGAAPQGPAGTGKTESTKDLAKNLGRFCIVYNCSDQVTVHMMEKQFIGVMRTGAWLCLDEFNRIDIEVLSVIAQQVSTMRSVLLEGASSVNFGGKTIEIETNSEKHNVFQELCVFTTMNPTYAGRTALPDNLKVLFRPVAMMVPDYVPIAQILLYSEGFANAKPLSIKMTKLFALASEQLSQQPHYDFGLRAVKSILNMAGNLKRENIKMDENLIIIQAMRDANVPKFIQQDIELFDAIVRDLFPDEVYQKKDDMILQNAILKCTAERGLNPSAPFIKKCIEFHDIVKIRFGSMLVGPAMAGKSSVLHVVRSAYNAIGEEYSEKKRLESYFKPVNLKVINPKSISMSELFGETNPLTGDWTDGLASMIFSEFIDLPLTSYHWIVFDGPVDSLWIENMNSVLDDSMTLCLANGKRMKLRWNLRALFEVQDLAQASLATVSRCGMIYLDRSVTPLTILCQKLVKNLLSDELNETLRDYLTVKIDATFEKAIPWLSKNGVMPVACTNGNLMSSCIRLLQCFLKNDSQSKKLIENPETEAETVKSYLNKIFILAFSWSVLSTLDDKSAVKFEQFTSNNMFSLNDLPRGMVLDHSVSATQNEWIKWEPKLSDFSYSIEAPWHTIVVPTRATVKYKWVISNLLKCEFPVFFTGVSGTGKTLIAQDTLNELKDTESIVPISMTFSAKTDSKSVQNSIESKLNPLRQQGIIWMMPPSNQRGVIFIDDINMPEVERFGAQPPIELLRQLLDSGGFFDRSNFSLKMVKKTALLAVAAPPEGVRATLSERFMRHLNVICMPPTEHEIMQQIFTTILLNFFSESGFPSNQTDSLGGNIVLATLGLYSDMLKKMLPTPTKPTYLYNLRDVSKVFQGICQIKADKFKEEASIIKLWIHECTRVFADRLVSLKDKDTYWSMMGGLLQPFLGCDWDINETRKNEPIFGDFINASNRSYEEIKDHAKMLRVIANQYMVSTPITIELFGDCVRHLCSVSRSLRMSRGNVLLIGAGGSGKKSIVTVASAMAESVVMMIEPSKNFGLREFRKEIFEKMLYPSGVEGKSVTFLFPDTHILDEAFLEEISSLINTGEIVLLREFQEKINSDIEKYHTEAKSEMDLGEFYLTRVRENLHITLAMSPVGDALRKRLAQFPSFVNCCSIDWLDKWPEEALHVVSKKTIIGEKEKAGLTQQEAELVSWGLVSAHQAVDKVAELFFKNMKRQVYVTPKNYLDLIKVFMTMMQEKKEEIVGTKIKLSTGLDKLEKARDIVAQLKLDIDQMQPILDAKSIEADKLIEVLDIERSEARKKKSLVQEEEAIVKVQAREIEKTNEKANEQLKAAGPRIEEAKQQCERFERSDLAELKGLPISGVIKELMEVMMIVFDAPTSEQSIKSNIGDAHLVMHMKTIDPKGFKKSTLDKLREKRNNPGELEDSKVKAKSAAALKVLHWVWAITDAGVLMEDVKALEKKAAEMQVECDKAMAILKSKSDEVAKYEAQVKELEDRFNSNKAEKERLDAQIEKCKRQLENADKLTTGLADEQIRWKETVAALELEIEKLLGDAFLSAASLAYHGPFSGAYRDKLIALWKKTLDENSIKYTEKFTLTESIGDALELSDWNTKGLPSDTVSQCNGILVKRAPSYAYLIDPQVQGNRWIGNNEKQNGLRIFKGNDEQAMLKGIELCAKSGFPCLIEDMGETLHPALDMLLLKQFKVLGGNKYVKITDQEFELDPGFHLYFSSKITNPMLFPETFIRVSVVNFIVTEPGLQEQLLSEVIKNLMPKIEEEKVRLAVSLSEDLKMLRSNQKMILELLSANREDFLDDEVLIQKLETSKVKSELINTKILENEETNKKIDEARSGYNNVAARGAMVFFVVADLANVDQMYQFSLKYFLRLFNAVISTTEKPKEVSEHVELLIRKITQAIYLNICRGLFNEHKRIFSFLLASAIEQKETKRIKMSEWEFFLKGPQFGEEPLNIPKPANINEAIWKNLSFLPKVSPAVFEKAVKSMSEAPEAWLEWVGSEEPYKEELPSFLGEGEEKESSEHPVISLFSKLLLIKVMRLETTMLSMNHYVEEVLGKVFSDVVTVSLEEVLEESDYKTPLIFVLSQGVDPMSNIQRLAKEKNKLKTMGTISLGQGQEKKAERLINTLKVTGEWVVLQNCHLSKTFMPILERILEQLEKCQVVTYMQVENDAGSPNGPGSSVKSVPTHYQAPQPLKEEITEDIIDPNFRLFLTSMPCSYFPISVLQGSVKMTNEPPKSIKANMFRTFSELPTGTLESCSKPEQWHKLLFSLSLYHAIVQERRKFGPLGWNNLYDFNESDLDTSFNFLKIMIEQYAEIPYDALVYMVGDITYGGRVTDRWDKRVLQTILNIYCGEHVLHPKFTFTPDGKYAHPKKFEINSVREFIKGFPDYESPDLFGMHSNAQITYMKSESQNAITIILNLQGASSAGEGAETMTSEEKVGNLIEQIEKQFPPLIKREGKTGIKNLQDPLEITLFQEVEKFNRLLKRMAVSLKDLTKALKGEAIMSEELDQMFSALLKNIVPLKWQVFPSLKPLAAWYQDLQERVEFFRKWFVDGKPNSFLLSAFFFPQGFLTSVLQSFARAEGVPIDQLSFEFEFKNFPDPQNIASGPSSGAYIYGLFMEGARWDTSRVCLADNLPGVLYTMAPVIYFNPKPDLTVDTDKYQMPLYKTLERKGELSSTGHSTNFVVAISCPTKQKPEYWVLNGAAFLCALNY